MAILLIDIISYRPLVYLLSVLAISLPVVALAIFFQAIIKFKNNASIVLSSFLSSLFWVGVAALTNGNNTEENSQSLLANGALSLGVFTIGASIVLYIIKYLTGRIGRHKK